MICVSSFLFVCLCFFSYVDCMSLPDYIPVCKRNDPNLDTCALEAARVSIGKFSLGDPSRDLQPLDPLFVKELVVTIGPGDEALKLVFLDNVFTGLSNLELSDLNVMSKKNPRVIGPKFYEKLPEDIITLQNEDTFHCRFDLEKKIITTKGLVNLNVKSQYDLSGKILFIPITGNGDASIRLKNTTLNIQYWYEHVEGPDGKVHWNIIKDEMKYEVGRAFFRLENLLNADKRIGDQINNLLNQLWREIVADVGPSISKALSKPVMENLKTLLTQVPFDEIMPPE